MVTYDPADPRWVLDPGPLFDEIRETAPVHFTADGYWVVSRHEDCLALLRNKDASADGMNTDPTKRPDALRRARRDDAYEAIRAGAPDTRPFLFRDPPDHTRLRGLVQKAFTPRRVAELTPFIEQRARLIINAHVDSGPFDAVNALAWSLPVSVICEMLDIPDSDHDTFKTQSALLARGLDPEFLLSPEELEARDLAILHFAAYFHELFDQRRQRPGEDLMSALVAARDGGDQLSEGELLSTVILLLVAGHETTMNLISGSLLLLTQDEQAQATLRNNPGLDRTATEEFLRLVAPVQLTGRSLAGDIVIDGHLLERGTFGFLLIGGANRDPLVFENPTTLQMDRERNPHLGFGFGLHHCLGAPLARLESSIVLRELLNATSSFTRSDEPVRYRPNVVLRGIEELQLTLHS
jgi:cytochrome P450